MPVWRKFKESRFYGFPFWWSLKTAWGWRKPTKALVEAWERYEEATAMQKEKSRMAKLEAAQSEIPHLFSAEALREFQIEFSDIYDNQVMAQTFGAVGPMDAFLGFLVQTGRIEIKKKGSSAEGDIAKPCSDVQDPLTRKSEARDTIRSAIKNASQVIDDWVVTYAGELCYEEYVKVAEKRIMDGGGTLAYTANALELNRKALSELDNL